MLSSYVLSNNNETLKQLFLCIRPILPSRYRKKENNKYNKYYAIQVPKFYKQEIQLIDYQTNI